MPGPLAKERRRARREQVRENADQRSRWKKAKREKARKEMQVLYDKELSLLGNIRKLQYEEATSTELMRHNMRSADARLREMKYRKKTRRAIHALYCEIKEQKRKAQEAAEKARNG